MNKENTFKDSNELSAISHHGHSTKLGSLIIAALGVVFGDIGTSPLYAIRESFYGAHALAINDTNVLGVLSLVFWALVVVVSIGYVSLVLRANNNGEGGVLAITALVLSSLSSKKISRHYTFLLYIGLFGAALLVSDGIITPAISVLSAVEGLSVATHKFDSFVLPITITILILLFLGQKQGTQRIGTVFGFILLIWFLVLGFMGIHSVIENVEVLKAINPIYAIEYFKANKLNGFLNLTSVFLTITGAEALYADLGHFGRKPISRAWFFIVMPAVLLNYFGQGALLLRNQSAAINPFYKLAPAWGLYPLVGLATLATIIASQAVISGVFSLTRQAVQLGYFPRFRIIHTSSDNIGQVYIAKVNWALLVLTCWLVLEFRSSNALANAYGVAISTTMLITVFFAIMTAFFIWKWNILKIIFVFFIFFFVELSFFTANLSKVLHGGWFPLLIGFSVFTLMITWKKGRIVLQRKILQKTVSFKDFQSRIQNLDIKRVKGTAIFMTGDATNAPPALIHNIKHNKVIHENNLLITIKTLEVPYVEPSKRIEYQEIIPDFKRVIAYYGFAESPNILQILEACKFYHKINIDLDDTTFFLGRETLIASKRDLLSEEEKKDTLPLWQEKLFSFMSKNAERATDYYGIPVQKVVEMGIQIEM
jgi:KUP system potassium uptake protein